MTPIATSRNHLMLRARPWLLGLGIGAAMLLFAAIAIAEISAGDQEAANGPLILLVLFAVAFAVFVRQDEVTFDRPAGTISIRRRTVFGGATSVQPLAGLRRASVEVHKDDVAGHRKATCRPVLEFHNGPNVPLTPVYSAGTGADQAVKAVNAWLRMKG